MLKTPSAAHFWTPSASRNSFRPLTQQPSSVVSSSNLTRHRSSVVSGRPSNKASLSSDGQPFSVAEIAHIVSAERNRIIAQLFHRCSSRAQAEDIYGEVTQRLLVKLRREPDSFCSVQAVIGWLLVAGRFVLREKHRSTDALDRTQICKDMPTNPDHSDQSAHQPAVLFSTIEEQLGARDQLRLLQHLSPSDRQLLQEVAEGHRPSPRTDRHRRRIFRARQRAHRLIDDIDAAASLRCNVSAQRMKN